MAWPLLVYCIYSFDLFILPFWAFHIWNSASLQLILSRWSKSLHRSLTKTTLEFGPWMIWMWQFGVILRSGSDGWWWWWWWMMMMNLMLMLDESYWMNHLASWGHWLGRVLWPCSSHWRAWRLQQGRVRTGLPGVVFLTSTELCRWCAKPFCCSMQLC